MNKRILQRISVILLIILFVFLVCNARLQGVFFYKDFVLIALLALPVYYYIRTSESWIIYFLYACACVATRLYLLATNVPANVSPDFYITNGIYENLTKAYDMTFTSIYYINMIIYCIRRNSQYVKSKKSLKDIKLFMKNGSTSFMFLTVVEILVYLAIAFSTANVNIAFGYLNFMLIAIVVYIVGVKSVTMVYKSAVAEFKELEKMNKDIKDKDIEE